jgi:WhiB family redox-sensing transcriptional regulator
VHEAAVADVLVVPTMAERVARKVADSPHESSDTSWRSSAACCDTDPDLFFPVGTTGQAIEQIEQAQAVCMGCPAQVQCLEFALRTNQDTGIWGGTSEETRRHLRRTYLGRRRRTAV